MFNSWSNLTCATGLSSNLVLLGTDFLSQPVITCSKLAIETLEKDVKYVQS